MSSFISQGVRRTVDVGLIITVPSASEDDISLLDIAATELRDAVENAGGVIKAVTLDQIGRDADEAADAEPESEPSDEPESAHRTPPTGLAAVILSLLAHGPLTVSEIGRLAAKGGYKPPHRNSYTRHQATQAASSRLTHLRESCWVTKAGYQKGSPWKLATEHPVTNGEMRAIRKLARDTGFDIGAAMGGKPAAAELSTDDGFISVGVEQI